MSRTCYECHPRHAPIDPLPGFVWKQVPPGIEACTCVRFRHGTLTYSVGRCRRHSTQHLCNLGRFAARLVRFVRVMLPAPPLRLSAIVREAKAAPLPTGGNAAPVDIQRCWSVQDGPCFIAHCRGSQRMCACRRQGNLALHFSVPACSHPIASTRRI